MNGKVGLERRMLKEIVATGASLNRYERLLRVYARAKAMPDPESGEVMYRLSEAARWVMDRDFSPPKKRRRYRRRSILHESEVRR